ncbi:SecDF P1 head subdomain-containing protein [Streptomyces sp. NPDC018031]|uniref:SecDF P1 head subdomain-containing protein n=1 Tax=Streptomyces sp. NPDC018031 TaxID=3365033 RepID=UPI00378980ED
MRSVGARSGWPVALALTAALVTGCGGDGDGDGRDRDDEAVAVIGGGRGEDSPPPRTGPVEPLDLVLVEREEAGPCPSGAAPGSTFRDSRAGSCLYVSTDPGARMTVTRPKSVKYAYETNGNGHSVNVELTAADARGFAGLSGKAAARQAPANRIAMVQDGELLSAPTVMTSITGGEIQISGGFTRDSAQRLARDLGGA